MKKGVSLIIMAVIIVVLSVITGVTVYSSRDSINMSKRANFFTNMSKLQDAVTAYYATTGILPVKSNAAALTKEQLLDKVDASVKEELSNKISSNGDDEGKFYALDIKKINVEETVYNITEDSDVLYINDMGTCVYYITGVKIDEKLYFALDVYTTRPEHFLCGDVDGDGKIDSLDKVTMIGYVNGGNVEINLKAADLNLDGKVDSQDVQILTNYIAGLVTELNCPDY